MGPIIQLADIPYFFLVSMTRSVLSVAVDTEAPADQRVPPMNSAEHGVNFSQLSKDLW